MRIKTRRASGPRDAMPCPGAEQDGTDWYITINTLDDLIRFVIDVESIVITDNRDGEMHILIYDDYIE